MTAPESVHEEHDSAASLPILTFALLGGLVAWMVHLSVAMGLVGAACTHGLEWLVHVTTGVTGAVALAAVLAGVRVLRATRGADPGGWEVRGRETFMGFVGVLLSGIGLALIVFEGVPAFILEPCT